MLHLKSDRLSSLRLSRICTIGADFMEYNKLFRFFETIDIFIWSLHLDSSWREYFFRLPYCFASHCIDIVAALLASKQVGICWQWRVAPSWWSCSIGRVSHHVLSRPVMRTHRHWTKSNRLGAFRHRLPWTSGSGESSARRALWSARTWKAGMMARA